jgi:phosphatidylserine/phosphatidylglycerophosphate/cardiolipin synthase-like enzyme
MPGSSINLHAKCVVVDDRFALIGSANFTHNAQARNIEVGVLLDDPVFAQDLVRQWLGLVEAGLVTERSK